MFVTAPARHVNAIDDPGDTILLGNQSNKGHYYMDSDAGDQDSVLAEIPVFGV